MNKKNTINESMLDLFKSEINTQSKKITTSLNTLTSCTDLKTQYESLINHTRAIKGAANLVHIDIIIPLVEALERTFCCLQKNNIKPDNATSKILIITTDLFYNISEFTTDEFNSPSQSTSQEITTCINNLSNISNTNSSININEITSTAVSMITKSEPIFFSTVNNIDPEMFVLFCTELQNSINIINNNLLDLESHKNNSDNSLEAMMRAAHSIKGAARMIGIDAVVKLAHAMEDVFVAAQHKHIFLDKRTVDQLLNCNDLLIEIEKTNKENISHDITQWTKNNTDYLNQFINSLVLIKNKQEFSIVKLQRDNSSDIIINTTNNESLYSPSSSNMVKVSTRRINKLVSLAGELSVSSNWIRQYADSMLTFKRKHNEMLDQIDRLRSLIEDNHRSDFENKLITSIQHKAENYRDEITSRLISLDNFDRHSSNINSQINHEIIASRMRPFSDTTHGYKRLARDLSSSLNKQVKLEIEGQDTPVDRDILEKLDAPLNHIIRNAIDHGIETPDVRRKKGKPETGTIKISASHQSGRLKIQIKDDGCGVDIELLRKNVLDKNLVNSKMADNLSKSELLDFLFLPSFTTRSEVTELSGRGVGLDIVHSALQEVRGKLHADTEIDLGMIINMELPLTLSVIRSLMVSINNELYAFPLAEIQSLVTTNKQDISVFENKQYITVDDKHIGLIHCAQILGIQHSPTDNQQVHVIIIGDWNMSYGLVVDELIGERGLALRTLNKKLGKIKDISSVAITDDGEPVLVFDIDDLHQSIQNIISGKNLYKVGAVSSLDSISQKRVLVVDDSLTVREIEKKLLESKGYQVDVAIDGVDGWNTVRNGNYDLVISDIDMPRMNGIEFITMIKNDTALRNIPVMMVSYKDRAEDKQKGMQAGADYYLTKGSFHDDTLLDAVVDLIGEATD